MFNQKFLKSILNYNKKTGIFIWKKPFGYKMKQGDTAGSNSHGYIGIRISKKLYSAHRLAWIYVYGKSPKYDIDHINGNKKDNRISNLRDITHLENSYNTLKPHKNSKHGIVGITWDKNKWLVRIRTKLGRLTIGRYVKKEDAGNAYLEAKRKYHLTKCFNG